MGCPKVVPLWAKIGYQTGNFVFRIFQRLAETLNPQQTTTIILFIILVNYCKKFEGKRASLHNYQNFQKFWIKLKRNFVCLEKHLILLKKCQFSIFSRTF